MSFRRKTYDGDIFGRSTGTAERGNTFDFAGKTDKYASTKRTAGNGRNLRNQEDLFQEEADKDRYLITYSDLITLLLGLFIILYAISNVDLTKYSKMSSAMGNIFGTNVKAINNDAFNSANLKVVASGIEDLKTRLNDVIVRHNYAKSVSLEENERGITIHILENILFPSGKADINKTSQLVLGELASILHQLPNDIRVEGHTDNIPINSDLYPSNWHLSVARALNTAYFLIDGHKLIPEKVTVVGYAEYKPIAENTTPEGRAKNRRVDIVIIK